MTIAEWLKAAQWKLAKAGVDSARLDAELILAHTLRKPRTYLHAHDSEEVSKRHEEILGARLQMRIEHTPIAYIIGHKEFYGRQFKTTPAALIPRPETEDMIETLGKIIPKNLQLLPQKIFLVDVGTGTGCLGITAKLEWPTLDVTLVDISSHALNLAKENAKTLDADVYFVKNDLLRDYSLPIHIILANLPYVDHAWDVSPEASAEPREALYANDGGLSLIHKLIGQAAALLKPRGYLLLESDARQQKDVIEYASKYGFQHLDTKGLITSFRKR